jgi:hypothetical protein
VEDGPVDAGTTVGLAIALGTLLVTLWLGRSRLRQERLLTDLEDARSVLAEGAGELKRIGDSLNDIHARLLPFQEERPEEDVLPIFEQGRARLIGGEAVQAALRIRFARESRPVACFDQALGAAFWATTKMEQLALSPKSEPAKASEEMFDAFERFEQQRDSYLVAAQKAVGSIL